MNNNQGCIISKKESLLEKENRLLEKLKKYKKKLDKENNKYEITDSNRKNNITQNKCEECPHCNSGKKRELELRTMLESKKKKQK